MALTVDPCPTVATSPLIQLTGTKDPSVSIVYVDNSSARSNYPSATEWRADLLLAPGHNTVSVQGEDVAGTKTGVLSISIELPAPRPSLHNTFGTLDEYGLELGLSRLPGEKNFFYRARLLAVETLRPNSSYPGLLYAVARDLSVQIEEAALTISVLEDSVGQKRLTNAFLTIDPMVVWVEAKQFLRTREIHRVDPGSLRIVLDYHAVDEVSIQLTDIAGSVIHDLDYLYDDQHRWITVKDPNLAGQYLLATYQYRYRIDLQSDTTVAYLMKLLQDIKNPEEPALSVLLSGNGDRLARLLIRPARSSLDSELTIDYCPIGLFPLHDREVVDRKLNPDGTFFESTALKYVRQLRTLARDRWRDLLLDRDLVGADIPNQQYSHLPNLLEPRLGYWLCQNPTHTVQRTVHEDAAYHHECPVDRIALLEYRGTPVNRIRSGKAGVNSLYVVGVNKHNT